MSDAQHEPGVDLAAQVAAARWYHAMPLPGGIVTPGDYDMPDVMGRIPFPEDLSGKRCLDVGTRDGFFAFEMERRGAAEVIGIDIFDPARVDFPHPRPKIEGELREGLEERASTFEIAAAAFGSKVKRVDLSVYDLPGSDIGEFDFAFIGTLLLHLRDPARALAAIASVLKTGGTLVSNEPYSVVMALSHPRRAVAQIEMRGPRPFWWIANPAGHRQLVQAAGFEIVETSGTYLMRYGAGWARPSRPSLLNLRDMVGWLTTRRGAPHTAVLARCVT
jgi:tRNA (mo5U34)-methyltransferase